MTDDDTRLDAQVRRALTTLPAPDECRTREALLSVLERSGRTGRHRTRAWTAPIAAAAAVGVLAGAVAVGTLVGGPDVPAPAGPSDPLTGTWQRRVTDATPGSLDGRWTMTLTRDGVVRLTGPADAPPAEGTSYSAGSSRVRLDAFANNVCAELPAATYAWRTAGTALTLSLVDDPCTARAGLFLGTWRRVR